MATAEQLSSPDTVCLAVTGVAIKKTLAYCRRSGGTRLDWRIRCRVGGRLCGKAPGDRRPHLKRGGFANIEALALLEKAIALDPNFAPATAHAAWCYEQRIDEDDVVLKGHGRCLAGKRLPVTAGSAA